MRVLSIALVLGMALAGDASAQRERFGSIRPAPTAEELAAAELLSGAPYTALPSVADHRYVSRQLERAAGGVEYDARVPLECLVESDGGLACAAIAPAPSETDLEWALKLITRFRVASTTEAGVSTAGRRVRPLVRMGVARE